MVKVDTHLVNPYSNNFKYFYRIGFGASIWWYMANNPFYAFLQDDGLWILVPEGCYRTEGKGLEYYGNEGVGYKNHIFYKKDFRTRTWEECNTIVSNYPIYEWST